MAIKFKVNEKENKLKDSGNSKNLKIKKNWKIKLEIVLLVISIICTLMMISYVAIPVISVFVGVLFYIVVTMIVLVIGACTLFLIFLSPNVRNGVGKYYGYCNQLMSGGSEATKFLTSIFPIFAPICSILVVISLVYSIIVFKKNTDDTLKFGYKSRMLANIALAVICVGFIIADLITYFTIK